MNAPTDTPVTMIIKVTDVHCLLWSHRHAVKCFALQKIAPTAHECSMASWNEILHQSLRFLFSFKIFVFCY